jgi:hypothetical protein
MRGAGERAGGMHGVPGGARGRTLMQVRASERKESSISFSGIAADDSGQAGVGEEECGTSERVRGCGLVGITHPSFPSFCPPSCLLSSSPAGADVAAEGKVAVVAGVVAENEEERKKEADAVGAESEEL